MLDDHERETLREIQRRMFVDDPDFERSFRALGAPAREPVAVPPGPHRWAYAVVIGIAALLATVLLLAGSVGGALAFTVIAAAVWLARHLENAARKHEPGD